MSLLKEVHPVVLLVGLGKRLWAFARSDNPKQYSEIIKGNKTLHLEVNESVYLDIGKILSVKNLSKFILRIIEVQVGDYLGKDDIARLVDIYDRT